MSIKPKPSAALKWNVLDTRSTLLWTAVAAAITYAGPYVVAWLDACGGYVSLLVVPAVVAAGRALVRWISDNKNH